MRRPSITHDEDSLLWGEARKRVDCLSNKELAEKIGKSLRYVANRMAHVRRRIEIEVALDNVPRGISDKSELEPK